MDEGKGLADATTAHLSVPVLAETTPSTLDPEMGTVSDAVVNVAATNHDDGIDDNLQYPQNWSARRKWAIIVLTSAVTFNQAMSSTMFAPAAAQATQDLLASCSPFSSSCLSSFGPENTTTNGNDHATLTTLLISIYVIGLAVGPLALAPLSEQAWCGRSPVVHATNFAFVAAAVMCALSVNVAMLLVGRLVMGICTVSLGGAYVADLMGKGIPQDRARAMNVWTVGPVLAPVVGPILGGFISLSTSWRWTFGVVAISGTVSTVICLLFLPETYLPRLLLAREARAQHHCNADSSTTGNNDPQETPNPDNTRGRRPCCQVLLLPVLIVLSSSVARPLRMLHRAPALAASSLLLALAYSYMYLLFATFTDVFETAYGFDAGAAGLAYLGLGIGSLAGQVVLDRAMRRYLLGRGRGLSGQNAGDARGGGSDGIPNRGLQKPEHQLASLVPGGLLLPLGLLVYGWGVAARAHWIVPILGTAVCGIAISFFFLAVQTYLVDAYTARAASALAASTLVRCVFGVTIPLSAPSLYAALGYGWGNTLLAGLALTVLPGCWWLMRHGENLRGREKLDWDS